MALRYRSSVFVAVVLLMLYFLFWKDGTPFQGGSHTIDALEGLKKTAPHGGVEDRPPADAKSTPEPVKVVHEEGSTSSAVVPGSSTSAVGAGETSASSTALKESTSVAAVASSAMSAITSMAAAGESTSSSQTPVSGGSQTSLASAEATSASLGVSVLQEQFDKEYDALGLKESAGAIYGTTLNHLAGAGAHAGFHAAALTATESWTSYSNTPPYTYNPYPDYNNNKTWKTSYLGEYVPCDGSQGALGDVVVFSGHPEIFEEPLVGSYGLLDIDSNLCFERQARLGTYGYLDKESEKLEDTNEPSKAIWATIDWKVLQEACVSKNANRYAPIKAAKPQDTNQPPTQEKPITEPKTDFDTGALRRARATEAEDNLHGMPKDVTAQLKSRTAILLRSSSENNYTDNEIQTIRSLATELSLRSGGEYTVYLLVEVENSEKALWSDSLAEAEKANVPKEFRSITIVWNAAMMESFYTKSEKDDAFHLSQWQPVQRFANDYPQYDFIWNLGLDYRYTGHHYNLLEKLVAFAKAQPRKGLWERSERFYIPSVHGPYNTKFRDTVEVAAGSEAVWGPPAVEGVEPLGPARPEMDSRDDNHVWGVDEEADYISLSPIFNPTHTNWTGRDEIWGYAGADLLPRRASVGMDSRCSKQLLAIMDKENRHGKHIGSEMGPPTVALLHGLKAVYPPVPMFFDRAWNGSSLDKFLNPGPKGESGGSIESPFSAGRDTRFEGSTWYERAVVPRRLYNNWMGWEYRGVGGPEWEKAHGRICLPPMLLHPINDVVKPPPDHASKS